MPSLRRRHRRRNRKKLATLDPEEIAAVASLHQDQRRKKDHVLEILDELKNHQPTKGGISELDCATQVE